MNVFKSRHFDRDIILWAVRWYCKYGISYRELQEMLAERGVNVDHTTIYRRVQRYAPDVCAGTGDPLQGSAPGISIKLISQLTVDGFICAVPLTAEAPSIFISPLAVTVKRHIGFWVRS